MDFGLSKSQTNTPETCVAAAKAAFAGSSLSRLAPARGPHNCCATSKAAMTT